jgi:hypothetical protein
MKRTIERARLQQEPHLVWNAFIDLLAISEYGDLSLIQRKAHLVFWYDSEVQNGGHGQYFENRGVSRLGETVAALRNLGLECQAETLPDSFIDELDAAFHGCTPTVTEALEQHLARHTTEYVEEGYRGQAPTR